MAGEKELRQTKQRRKLLDIFKKTSKPLTAEQILKSCQVECPNMALTTVYRNLDRLIDLGQISKTVYPDGTARYTSSSKGHKHMVTCRICQAQVEVDFCPVQMSEELISQQTGYLIEHHYLEFYGICPACLKRELPFKRRRTHLPGVVQDGTFDEPVFPEWQDSGAVAVELAEAGTELVTADSDEDEAGAGRR